MITVSVVGDELRIDDGARVLVLDPRAIFGVDSDPRLPPCPSRPLLLAAEDAAAALADLSR